MSGSGFDAVPNFFFPICFVRHRGFRVLNHIYRTVFCLDENLTKIFAYDAERNQLNASKEEDNGHKRGIALHRVVVESRVYESITHEDESR